MSEVANHGEMIDCARKLFATISNGMVTYDHVDNYQQLLNKVMN